jgi:hypothetical protein
MIDNFNSFKNYNKLTLYHGTFEENGKFLVKNGWKPLKTGYGSNFGNPNSKS